MFTFQTSFVVAIVTGCARIRFLNYFEKKKVHCLTSIANYFSISFFRSIYKAARHCLNWGDMLPLDEAKRPMNIRKPIHPKRITNNRSDDNRSDGDIL